MKLTIKLDAINHGDVAVKLMPLLAQSAGNFHGAVGETVAAIANLPDSLVRDIFDAIPEDEKNGIIAAYAMNWVLTLPMRKQKKHLPRQELNLLCISCAESVHRMQRITIGMKIPGSIWH